MLRGNCSDWSPVISGVPQGTVLGPILFIIYKNDISANIASTVKIYADDTKIYRKIMEPDKDIPALQLDLNKLSDWANKWQLRFNPEKCEVMRVTHSRDRSKPSYSLGTQLKSVDSAKDLGVKINYDLSWGKHVSYIVNKANKVLGIIRRSLGNDNRYAFSCLFKSLVRPILEYAVPVWSPYQKKDIESLEKVQRRASRLALKQKRGEMSYEDRCRLLNWQTLEKRREFLSLIQCYKIVLEIDSLHFSDFFELTKCNRTRANHDYKLYVKIAIVNCYKFSFFVRIVNMWNNLPKDIVHAGSLTLFRNRLKIYTNID